MRFSKAIEALIIINGSFNKDLPYFSHDELKGVIKELSEAKDGAGRTELSNKYMKLVKGRFDINENSKKSIIRYLRKGKRLFSTKYAKIIYDLFEEEFSFKKSGSAKDASEASAEGKSVFVNFIDELKALSGSDDSTGAIKHLIKLIKESLYKQLPSLALEEFEEGLRGSIALYQSMPGHFEDIKDKLLEVYLMSLGGGDADKVTLDSCDKMADLFEELGVNREWALGLLDGVLSLVVKGAIESGDLDDVDELLTKLHALRLLPVKWRGHRIISWLEDIRDEKNDDVDVYKNRLIDRAFTEGEWRALFGEKTEVLTYSEESYIVLRMRRLLSTASSKASGGGPEVEKSAISEIWKEIKKSGLKAGVHDPQGIILSFPPDSLNAENRVRWSNCLKSYIQGLDDTEPMTATQKQKVSNGFNLLIKTEEKSSPLKLDYYQQQITKLNYIASDVWFWLNCKVKKAGDGVKSDAANSNKKIKSFILSEWYYSVFEKVLTGFGALVLIYFLWANFSSEGIVIVALSVSAYAYFKPDFGDMLSSWFLRLTAKLPSLGLFETLDAKFDYKEVAKSANSGELSNGSSEAPPSMLSRISTGVRNLSPFR